MHSYNETWYKHNSLKTSLFGELLENLVLCFQMKHPPEPVLNTASWPSFSFFPTTKAEILFKLTLPLPLKGGQTNNCCRKTWTVITRFQIVSSLLMIHNITHTFPLMKSARSCLYEARLKMVGNSSCPIKFGRLLDMVSPFLILADLTT